MTDRDSLVALVWRRMPADLKVSTNGMRLVAVDGTMKELSALEDAELFTVLRRCAAVRSLLNSLNATEDA